MTKKSLKDLPPGTYFKFGVGEEFSLCLKVRGADGVYVNLDTARVHTWKNADVSVYQTVVGLEELPRDIKDRDARKSPYDPNGCRNLRLGQ